MKITKDYLRSLIRENLETESISNMNMRMLEKEFGTILADTLTPDQIRSITSKMPSEKIRGTSVAKVVNAMLTRASFIASQNKED